MTQETLEEVATKEGLYRCSQHNFNQAEAGYNAKWFKRGALFGAKWQQEISYSEEDMIAFGEFIFKNTLLVNVKGVEGIFKQFKNK
jgi:hypothetical protein